MAGAAEKVFEKYREKRERAERERRERVDAVYRALPRIREIDSEINLRGMENVRNILKEPHKSDEYNADLNRNLDRLEKEKNGLLDANGIPRDYGKCVYECAECSDTGYTPDGKKCRCLRQSIMDETFSESNIKKLLEKCTFEGFRFDYYSKDKGGKKYSPLENIQSIYNRTKSFCDCFDTSEKSLLFYGPTGLGKTYLSCAAAGRLIKEGYTVVYIRATKLFSVFEEYKFGRLEDKRVMDDLYGCDLLIIDDLGTEVNGKYNSSFLYDIFDDRTARGKKLIISTNLTVAELNRDYSSRFVSRLMEHFIFCGFYGDDIRMKKMMEE